MKQVLKTDEEMVVDMAVENEVGFGHNLRCNTLGIFFGAVFVGVLVLTAVLLVCPDRSFADSLLSGTCGKGVAYKIVDSDGNVIDTNDTKACDRGILVIYGQGAMNDYYYKDRDRFESRPPWYKYSRVNSNGYDVAVREVVIEEGVTHIGSHAFYADSPNVRNYKIEIDKVTFPSTLVSIGNDAFSDYYLKYAYGVSTKAAYDCCLAMSCERQDIPYDGDSGFSYVHSEGGVYIVATSRRDPYLVIPNEICGCDVVGIGGRAFSNNNILREIVFQAGSKVVDIDYWAFYHCSSLARVDFPSALCRIGNRAFWQCDLLSSVELPASATQIDPDAFGGPKNEGTGRLLSGSHGALRWSYDGNGALAVEGSGEVATFLLPLWSRYSKDISRVVVYDGITAIGPETFAGLNLSSVVLPASVKAIGDSAFKDCTSLASAVIADSSRLSEIGDYAFSGCTSLEAFSVPAGVEKMGVGAFAGCTSLAVVDSLASCQLAEVSDSLFCNCTSLKEAIMPRGVVRIGKEAFYCCELLTDVGDDAEVETIGDSAFECCTHLKSAPITPMLTAIGKWAFAECRSLAEVSFASDGSLETIPFSAFIRCTSLVSLELPEGLESIGTYAFYSCTSLASVVIPNSVRSMGDGAFDSCTSLADVILSDEMTAIPSHAFSSTALEHVVVPASVTSIGSRAFSNCSALRAFDVPRGVDALRDAFYGTNLETLILRGEDLDLSSGCFSSMAPSSKIYVTSRQMYSILAENENFIDVAKTEVLLIEGDVHLISDAEMDICDAVYDGSEHKPEVNVSVAGKVLQEGVDYRLVYADNLHAGRARVIAEGLGEYVGFAHGEFMISKATPVVSCELSSVPAAAVASGEGFDVRLSYAGDGTVVATTSNPGVATVEIEDEVAHILAVGPGTTVIDIKAEEGRDYISSAIGSFEMNVIENPDVVVTEPSNPNAVITGASDSSRAAEPVVGQKLCVSGSTYKVIDSASVPSVQYVAPRPGATKATVPAYIDISGTTCKVVSVSPKAFAGNDRLMSVTVNCTNIPSRAFAKCRALKTVKMGAAVETVGSSAFVMCTQLKYLAVGKNVVTIEADAFRGCNMLSKLVVPAKVSKIGKSAFQNCKKLKNVVIKTKKLALKNMGKKAFKGTARNVKVKVPKNKLKAYKKLLAKRGLSKKAKFTK